MRISTKSSIFRCLANTAKGYRILLIFINLQAKSDEKNRFSWGSVVKIIFFSKICVKMNGNYEKLWKIIKSKRKRNNFDWKLLWFLGKRHVPELIIINDKNKIIVEFDSNFNREIQIQWNSLIKIWIQYNLQWKSIRK